MAIPLLDIQKIKMVFGGLTALNHVSLQIMGGQICSLIGPNGSGKSTLFNCINGIYNGYEGKIFFKGSDISNLSSHKISRFGIARTYQNIELFSKMSVIDNIMVGFHYHIKTNLFTEAFRLKKFKEQENQFKKKALKIIETLNISKFKDFIITELPYGILKRVEIGRALAMDPALLLLDEPASGMNEKETEEITDLIFNLNKKQGITILLVEHDMSVVMNISNLIYVLNFGNIISKGIAEEVKQDPEVIKAFLGE